jgi:hypothetical protein
LRNPDDLQEYRSISETFGIGDKFSWSFTIANQPVSQTREYVMGILIKLYHSLYFKFKDRNKNNIVLDLDKFFTELFSVSNLTEDYLKDLLSGFCTYASEDPTIVHQALQKFVTFNNDEEIYQKFYGNCLQRYQKLIQSSFKNPGEVDELFQFLMDLAFVLNDESLKDSRNIKFFFVRIFNDMFKEKLNQFDTLLEKVFSDNYISVPTGAFFNPYSASIKTNILDKMELYLTGETDSTIVLLDIQSPDNIAILNHLIAKTKNFVAQKKPASTELYDIWVRRLELTIGILAYIQQQPANSSLVFEMKKDFNLKAIRTGKFCHNFRLLMLPPASMMNENRSSDFKNTAGLAKKLIELLRFVAYNPKHRHHLVESFLTVDKPIMGYLEKTLEVCESSKKPVNTNAPSNAQLINGLNEILNRALPVYIETITEIQRKGINSSLQTLLLSELEFRTSDSLTSSIERASRALFRSNMRNLPLNITVRWLLPQVLMHKHRMVESGFNLPILYKVTPRGDSLLFKCTVVVKLNEKMEKICEISLTTFKRFDAGKNRYNFNNGMAKIFGDDQKALDLVANHIYFNIAGLLKGTKPESNKSFTFIADCSIQNY